MFNMQERCSNIFSFIWESTMKKILFIIITSILIIAAILFIRPSKSLDKNLVLSEELMSDRPDSALQILEKLKPENFSGENRAMYALLITQAQFKNYKPIESDSLFKIAYDYFISGKDSLRKAQIYFYRARIDENLGKKDEAIKNYQKASITASLTNDYDLLALIYSRWGLFLRTQHLFDDALTIQYSALKYSFLNRDIKKQALVLKEIGTIYSATKKYKQALVYHRKALSLAHKVGNVAYVSDIHKGMGLLYRYMGENDSALYYVNLSLSLLSDSSVLRSRYLLKGDILTTKQEYDSARYYINLGREKDDLSSEATYCKLMSRLNEKLGNYENALSLSNHYADFIYKIIDTDKEETIAKLQKKYDYSLIKNENTQLELKNRNSDIMILIIFIIFILVIWFITYLYNKVRREKDEIIKTGREQLKQMADKLAEREMKLEEVQLKSKEDLDAFAKWAFSKNDAMIKIERLTNMRTSERIANKEEMKLTPNEIENLKEVIDICFNSFATRLSKRFPNITEDNILYCCLLKMKTPANSIAILLGVSDSSLVKRKYRLKKEISRLVEGCLSLEGFLLSF